MGRRPGRARRVPCGAPDPRRLRRRPCARTAGTGSRRPSCKRFRLMALLLHKCLPPGQPGLSLRPLCLKKGRVRLQKAPGPSKRGGATPGRRVGERPSRPWAFWRAGGRHPQRRPQKHLSPGDPSPSVSGRPRPPTHPGNGGGGGVCGGGGEGHLVITSLPTGGLVSVPGVSRRRGVGGGGGGEEVGGGGGAGYPARLSVLPNRKSYISCNHYEMFLISLVFVCSMCGPRQPLASLSGPGTGTPLLPRSGGEGWRRTSVAVPGTLVAS